MHAVCMHAIMADSRHSVMQKQLLLKKQIHTDGIVVSTNHMSSYNQRMQEVYKHIPASLPDDLQSV